MVVQPAKSWKIPLFPHTRLKNVVLGGTLKKSRGSLLGQGLLLILRCDEVPLRMLTIKGERIEIDHNGALLDG